MNAHRYLSPKQLRQVETLFDKVRLGYADDLPQILEALSGLPRDEIRDEWGYSVVAEAVKANGLDVVRFLLDNGFRADAITNWQYAARSCIFEAESKAMLSLLVERGANVNAKELSMGENPLLMHFAAMNPGLVPDVLALGADVNATNRAGQTAAHSAAQYFRLPMLKQLIEHGANLNLVDQWGYTPLLYAVEGVGKTHIMMDGTEVVQLLASQPGVDLTQKTGAGKSALQLAKRNDKVKRILRAAKISRRLEGAMNSVVESSGPVSIAFTL